MPFYPTPTGAPPANLAVAGPESRQSVLEYYAQQLDADYPGKNYGASLLNYAAAHPSLNADQASKAWAVTVGLQDIVAGIAAGVGGTAQATNQIAKGAATTNLNPLSWLAGITGISGHNLLIRTMKIVVGGVMLLAGIMKMSGAGKQVPVIAAAATKLPGVA